MFSKILTFYDMICGLAVAYWVPRTRHNEVLWIRSSLQGCVWKPGQLVQHVAIGGMGMSQGAKRDITHPCILWGSWATRRFSSAWLSLATDEAWNRLNQCPTVPQLKLQVSAKEGGWIYLAWPGPQAVLEVVTLCYICWFKETKLREPCLPTEIVKGFVQHFESA